MLSIGQELCIFLEAILSGVIVLASYNILRVLRRLIKHGIFMISLEDMIYWIGTGVYIFIQMYKTSDGNIRWFFVVGVLCGMLIFAALSKAFRKILKRC